MAIVFSAEELTATDRQHPPGFEMGFVSLGDEFPWDGSMADVDVSDLQCHALLASDLPRNSELKC